MTKYLIERSFSVGEDQMGDIGRRSKQLTIEEFPEITWHHSHVVVDGGGNVRTYCVYEAPGEEIIRSHADKLGWHNVDGIFEIAGDVTPDDFPLT
jgi:Protein of unknown function (DUF4242)